MPVRIRTALLAGPAFAAMLLAGCATTASGHPAGSLPPTARTTSPVSFPSASSSSQAPTTAATSRSGGSATSSTAASPSTGASTASCPTAAKYCDGFGNVRSGWQTADEAKYHAYYTKGQTFRMGESDPSTVTSVSPFDLGFTKVYSGRIDVDATPESLGTDGGFGVQCWREPIKNGGGAYSGFDLELTSTRAMVWLRDAYDGGRHLVGSAPLSQRLVPGRSYHLTFDCAQGKNPKTGYVQAQFAIWIGQQKVLAQSYDKTERQYDWHVADPIALLTTGKGTDVLFDNFAVTSLCKYYAGDYTDLC